MIIQKSKDKPLQFDANLEKIIFRTFEKRSKNSSCERTVLYIHVYNNYIAICRYTYNLLFFCAQYCFKIYTRKSPWNLNILNNDKND
jgi:hypothetical protein